MARRLKGNTGKYAAGGSQREGDVEGIDPRSQYMEFKSRRMS
jgi:hypothetical protein